MDQLGDRAVCSVGDSKGGSVEGECGPGALRGSGGPRASPASTTSTVMPAVGRLALAPTASLLHRESPYLLGDLQGVLAGYVRSARCIRRICYEARGLSFEGRDMLAESALPPQEITGAPDRGAQCPQVTFLRLFGSKDVLACDTDEIACGQIVCKRVLPWHQGWPGRPCQPHGKATGIGTSSTSSRPSTRRAEPDCWSSWPVERIADLNKGQPPAFSMPDHLAGAML